MRIMTALLLAVLAAPAVAQEQEIRSANLPRALEWRLLRMFDGGARRLEGDVAISRAEVVEGDVAVYGGPLRIAGRIGGDAAVVGGDVLIEPGGVVVGDVTVVGGEVRIAGDGRVGGTITSYGLGSRRRYAQGDRDRDRGEGWGGRDERRRWSDRGYSTLTVRAGSGYNRVEGLPLMFGPVIQTAGPDPLRVEALAIWRTEDVGGPETDRMGYQASVEQFLGGRRRMSVGATVFSVVQPLDPWQLSDLEASLAAAVFHDDFRDYYDRTGWSVFVQGEPARWARARLELRAEDHEPVPAGDPWSLFGGDDLWRLQPVVARGDVRTLRGTLTLDRRDDEDDPQDGWLARVAVERPVSGSLSRPALGGVAPETPYELDFTTGLLDLRRYLPVGYSSRLGVRLVGGGSLGERALPPQYQHALGGIGTLPGFGAFHADCGARSAVGTHGEDRYFTAYGCDRFALAQVEYRGTLSLGFGFGAPDWDEDDDWWDEVYVDLSPTWVVFLDAGRGWGYGEPALPGDRDTGTLFDAGAGFLIGDLGIYAALPLNGGVEQEPRFFIRLGRRF